MASLRAGVMTAYVRRPFTRWTGDRYGAARRTPSRAGKPLAGARARGSGSLSRSHRVAVRPASHCGVPARCSAELDEPPLPYVGVRAERRLVDEPRRPLREPVPIASRPKNPTFGLSMIAVREDAARGLLEHVLRRPAAHLSSRRDAARRARRGGGRGTARAPRASAPSTCGRSSGACRPRAPSWRVEVERAPRAGVVAVRAGRARARSASAVARRPSGPATAAERDGSVHDRSSRCRRVDRVRAASSVRDGAPARPGPEAAGRGPPSGAGRRASSRARRTRCLRSPEELVRALAGQRDRHVTCRELREREEPERREVGDRLVELTRRALEIDAARPRAKARARGGRCRSAEATARASGELVGVAVLRSRREKVLTGSLMLPRHQRDDQARVEAAARASPRAARRSSAGAGRPRRSGSTSSACIARPAAAAQSRLRPRVSPVRARPHARRSTDEPMPGEELADARERRARRRARSRASGRRRSPRSRDRRRRGRWRAGSSARRRTRRRSPTRA